MRIPALLFLLAAAFAAPGTRPAAAYPLDGYEHSGIARLEAYHRALDYLLERGRVPRGATLDLEDVRLRLADRSDFQLPPPDPAFSRALAEMLGPDAAGYAVALLDLSDPERPRYAQHRADHVQNPGSVGKIAVALAWFQALADLHPDDPAARERLLRKTPVTANGFIVRDSHEVPFWQPGDPRVVMRPIAEGDTASLWTYFDWMLSSSSNAAASMLMSHLMLLRHFGSEYPVSASEAAAYFEQTPRSALQRSFLDAMLSPLRRNDLDPDHLRQGSFFTREGKQRVAGTNSVATPRELMRFLVAMEKGRLVDRFSSLELKRLLYLTDRRIRYAASPALDDSAVYYKSGSWYSCKPEPGFVCEKYKGNARNFLNSIAIVESREPDLHYLVTVQSNVLRANASEAHRDLATRIHRYLEALHGADGGPPPGTTASGGR